MNDKEFMNKLDNEFSQFTGKVMDLAYRKLYPKPTKPSIIFVDGIWSYSNDNQNYRYVQHTDGKKIIQKGPASQVIQDVFIPKENGMKILKETYNTYKSITQKYEYETTPMNIWDENTKKFYDLTIQLMKDTENKRECIHLYHDGFYWDIMECAEEEMTYESPASGSDLFIDAETLCNIRGESDAVDYHTFFKKIGEHYKKEVLPNIIQQYSDEGLQSNIEHIDELLQEEEKMKPIWKEYYAIRPFSKRTESEHYEYIENTIEARNLYLEHFQMVWYNESQIKYLDKILKYIQKLLIKEQKERDNMKCNKYIINKILNSDSIKMLEERNIIGPDRTFEENEDQLNDLLLDTIHGSWWDKTLKELTTEYTKTLEKRELTREQMINKIIELCEKDLDIKERVAEWIIYETHPKYTDKYIYVDRIQNNDSDIKIKDILLYVITDGGNDLITMKKWWSYQIPEGENEEYTTEQIKSLYNKIK